MASSSVAMTCKIIVTCSNVKRAGTLGHAQALRPALPRRQDSRARRRPLDSPGGSRPAARDEALPGLAVLAPRDRAQHPVRSAQVDGGARARGAPVLLRSPAARG